MEYPKSSLTTLAVMTAAATAPPPTPTHDDDNDNDEENEKEEMTTNYISNEIFTA